MQPQEGEQRNARKKPGRGTLSAAPEKRTTENKEKGRAGEQKVQPQKKENNASQEKKKGGTLKYTGKGEHRNALGKREQLKKKTKKKGGRPSQPWAKGQTQGTRTEDKAKGSTIIHWEGGTYLCTGKKKTSN